MAYDQGLAERLRDYFSERGDVVEKKMFGGLCFLVSQHMCCGIVGDQLMARVGPDRYADCLQHRDARVMDFTGKPMKGMVYVKPEGISSDADLDRWVKQCVDFVSSLPPKKMK